MDNNITIEGFLPYGINEKDERLYFSKSSQRWKKDLMEIKISDILSTPTVPVKSPQKILKKVKNVGVVKIKLEIIA